MPIIRQARGAWAHFSVLEAARDWLWAIRVLSVARFEVRCVGIWKGQRKIRYGCRLRGDEGGGTRRACEGNIAVSSRRRRSRHVVGNGRVRAQRESTPYTAMTLP